MRLEPSDCSVVRDETAAGPRLRAGCYLKEIGRQSPRTRTGGRRSWCSFTASLGNRTTDTRGIGCAPREAQMAFSVVLDRPATKIVPGPWLLHAVVSLGWGETA